MAQLFLVVGSSLGLFLVIHLLVWRLQFNFQNAVLLLAAIGGLAYPLVVVSFHLLEIMGASTHIWISCPMHFWGVLLYIEFYMGIDRSVSIRILGELVRARGGELRLQELEQVYSKEYLLNSRLGFLTQAGYLSECTGAYSCKPKGVVVARFVIAWQRLYGLKTTG